MSTKVDDDQRKRRKSAMEECFVDALHFNLFPLKYDFKNVCSCNECSSNIAYLLKFEQDLKSKSKQVSECLSKMKNANNNCYYLAAASGWSVDFLDLFLHNLIVAHEKLGLTFSLGESERGMKDADLKIERLITDNGFFSGTKDEDNPFGTTSVPSKRIYAFIRCGLHRYDTTKVKEEAHVILREVECLEKLHEFAQVSAAEQIGKMLDPSVSKSCIEQQIELVKRLPVEKLIPEVEDEISKVSHITRNVDKLVEALSYTRDEIATIMVKTRHMFWQEYEEKHKGATGHDLTGLKDTLQKLRDTAKLFKARWTKDYAHWVAPYERSDPKRQRVE